MATVPHHARRRPLGEGFDLAELQASPRMAFCSTALLTGPVLVSADLKAVSAALASALSSP